MENLTIDEAPKTDGAGQKLQLGSPQGEVFCEWRLKFNAAAVSAVPINGGRLLGFSSEFDLPNGVQPSDGVYVEFDPAAGGNLWLVTAAGGIRTKTSGATMIVAGEWYLIGIRITYPGGTPTAQLLLNNVCEVSGQTANFPTAGLEFGCWFDVTATAATEPRILSDYVTCSHITEEPR